MGPQILNYAIVSPRITIDPTWIEQITSKCGTSKLETAFQTLSLVQSGVTGLFFGGYFGCLFQTKYCEGMTKYQQPAENSILKCAARLILSAGISLPILLLYLIKVETIPNDYLLMFVKSLLPLTVSGFLLFGVTDEISLRVGLYDNCKEYKFVDNQTEMLLYK